MDLGEGPRGPRLPPTPLFLVFSKCFRNVNVTLLLYVLKSEVFIYGGGGGRWGSRPPLSEFSGSAHAGLLILEKICPLFKMT